MMYKTIYRFRVRVEEKSLTFPLQLCIYQSKAPQFEDLLEKMRDAASIQGISMNDYYITLENNKQQGGVILHDDQSLQVALKQMSERHYLELALQRKRARTLSPPGNLPRRESMPVHPSSPTPSLSSLFSDIPVIKPTVLRWSPVNYTESRRSSSISINYFNQPPVIIADRRKSSMMMDIDTEMSSCSIRKDSGISLDDGDCDSDKEPVVKKQRAVSVDHQLMTRKLPDLHSTPSPLPSQHRPSLFESAPPIVHPLEFRRPSTAPPSPPGFSHISTPIKLPAITSLTTNNTNTQLAPIHRHLSYDDICSPPHTPCSTAKSSSSTSSEPPAAPRRASTTTKTLLHKHPSSSAVATTTTTSADALTSRTPGQFLCEHVVDAASGRMCGQTFRRSYDLSRHQSIHMKNRPFCYCNQCGKKFTRMDALRRHERVQGHATKRYNHRHPSATPSVHAQQARV